uniref:Uncharacterized protein n=1 Tax=candidate division WOR-3 bacterium TaxID=2052148 RepID=A0A7C4GC57_UNCW3
MFFGYFGAGSPAEFITPAGAERERWYNVTWQPSAVFDGRPGPQVQQPDSFYPVYRDMIDAARSRKTVLEMTLDPDLTRADSAQVSIGVRIEPTDSLIDAMANLALVAVVFEDSLPYEYLGDTLHAWRVVRRVLSDTWGIPVSLRLGTVFETTLVVPNPGWRPRLTGVAAFVQNTESKQVLQSAARLRLGN